MARAESTTSLGLRTRTNGVVQHQQTTKFNAEKTDELIAALQARVTALETGLNDSNSQFFNGTPG